MRVGSENDIIILTPIATLIKGVNKYIASDIALTLMLDVALKTSGRGK